MSTNAAGSRTAVNGTSTAGLGAVVASQIADDAATHSHYGVLEPQDVPPQYWPFIYFPRLEAVLTACIVPENEPHIIVHDGRANIGVLVFTDGFSSGWAAFMSSLAEKGICNVVRRLSQPIAYVAPPQSRERSSLSALVGYTADSFFPLYGELGAQARPGLEKALANPVKTLEERMGAMGYSLVNLTVGR